MMLFYVGIFLEIRLKEFGSESIEVIDYGLGIPEAQFEGITKKHCTSKLREFEDLAKVATFGFRGEALSSLCQLAEKVLVVSNGASASLRDNIAAVFGQNQLNSLIPLTEVITIPNDLLEEFNIKSSDDLEHIQLRGFISKPPGTQATSDSCSPSQRNSPKVGSSTTASHGRSSSDRQFVYVNNRPCDLPKITRLVTDLWRRCSREALSLTSSGMRMPIQSACSQYPVFVLRFEVPSASVDVNLTPDKRMLLLRNEKHVLALTKAVLLQSLYESTGVDLISLARQPSPLDVTTIQIVDLPVDSQVRISYCFCSILTLEMYRFLAYTYTHGNYTYMPEAVTMRHRKHTGVRGNAEKCLCIENCRQKINIGQIVFRYQHVSHM
ncbi:unnamed protein product [Echinostoma caproni]|uniref:DNA_mis_repair domain-containing protein n=1 Tax=Echinostoma caproni TaxID=27848 RepID=A0A183AP54_9TREM|nr:unnamed protein product [Echinostoma caproni]